MSSLIYRIGNGVESRSSAVLRRRVRALAMIGAGHRGRPLQPGSAGAGGTAPAFGAGELSGFEQPDSGIDLRPWATNLIGDGPSCQSTHPDESMRHALDESFGSWCENVSIVEDGTDLAALLNGVVRSTVSAGEAIVHLTTTQRGELRLRLLNPEQLDPSRNRELENMDRVVSGKKYDANGRLLGYYIFPQQPDLITSMAWSPVFVDAADVAHVFEARLPGQVTRRVLACARAYVASASGQPYDALLGTREHGGAVRRVRHRSERHIGLRLTARAIRQSYQP